MPGAVPIEALSQHVAVFGQTGAGKSYATRGFAEQLLALNRRVCVIDYTGVWHGLRSDADGVSDGYPIVIFGGEHADVPINESAGLAVAKFVAEGSVPTIIDLDGMTVGAQQRFMTAFAEELYRRNRRPLHLIIEEIDEFAPMTGAPGAERMLGAICRIFQRGRRKGFRCIAITQRPANVHTRVRGQCKTLITLQLFQPQDRKAFRDWIHSNADESIGKNVAGSLSGLKTGEGWVIAPSRGIIERTSFPPIRTFDSMKAPEDGNTVEPIKLMDVDLTSVRAEMAELVREAEETSVEHLQATIAELRKELAKTPETIVDRAAQLEDIERAYQRGSEHMAANIRKRLEPIRDAMSSLRTISAVCKRLEETLVPIEGMADHIDQEPPTFDTTMQLPKGTKMLALPEGMVRKGGINREPSQITERPPPPGRFMPGAPPSNGELTGPQQRVLGALAWWRKIGIRTPTRVQVAAFLSWSPRSSNIRDRVGELRRAGMVEVRGEYLGLTPEGLARAPEPDMDADLIDNIRGMLSAPQCRVFDHIPAGDSTISKAVLAAKLNWSPTSSNIRDRLGELRRLGLIRKRGNETYSRQEWVQ